MIWLMITSVQMECSSKFQQPTRRGFAMQIWAMLIYVLSAGNSAELPYLYSRVVPDTIERGNSRGRTSPLNHFSTAPLDDLNIMTRLQILPKLGRHAKITSKPDGRFAIGRAVVFTPASKQVAL